MNTETGVSAHGELGKVAGTMATRKKTEDDKSSLTHRETQVLRHLALGLSNKEIAKTLSISVETVKEHVQHVLRKIDVNDRTQAAVVRRPQRDRLNDRGQGVGQVHVERETGHVQLRHRARIPSTLSAHHVGHVARQGRVDDQRHTRMPLEQLADRAVGQSGALDRADGRDVDDHQIDRSGVVEGGGQTIEGDDLGFGPPLVD